MLTLHQTRAGSATLSEYIRALFSHVGDRFRKRTREILSDPVALFNATRNIDSRDLNRWFSSMRIFMVSALVIWCLLLWNVKGMDFANFLIVFLVSPLYLTANIFWHTLYKKRKLSDLLLHVQLMVDFLFFTTVIYSLGRSHSELALLYILTVLSASFISAFASTMSAVTAVILYTSLAYLGYNSADLSHIMSFIIMTGAVAVQSNFFITRLRKKEDDASKFKDAFLGMAMHQIRNPLATETLLLETVELEGKERMLPEHLQTIRQAKKMNENVAQFIKDFSVILKTEAHLDKLDYEEISLFETLREIIREIRLFPSKKIAVVCDFPDELESMRISTIPSFFRQIFQNLISNAVLYSHYHGRVKVSAKIDKDKILFEIKDEGIGISSKDSLSVFDPFFRGENAKKKEDGTGLGLFIVKRFADLLGFKVWFESIQGKGTSFFVSVPVNA